MSTKRKIVIDTDPGVDDAQAILMALTTPDVDVIGITCETGNVQSLQTAKNTLRVLQAAGRLDIPVHVGCSTPLLGEVRPHTDYHGADGLGDVVDTNAPDASHLQEEHAVTALLRISKEHEGEVTLICIGPLTNVAMAIRMDDMFGTRLKDCYIMGGNYQGRGNITVSAEFNFYSDPEAAYVVLNQLAKPITLVPWEVCDAHVLSWKFYNEIRSKSNKYLDFLKSIERKSADFARENKWAGFVPADEFLLASFLNPDVIKKCVDVYASVELKGHYTWGQMVVDWEKMLKKPANVRLVTEIEEEVFKDMLRKLSDIC